MEERPAMNIRSLALALGTMLLSVAAYAQERPETFPSRSVKIIVPFPPGGPTDILCRVIAQRMSEVWTQPVASPTRKTRQR